jgi:aminoglycoside phosphotransferase (APT) family kinase protein
VPEKTHTKHLDVPLVRRLLMAQFPQWADLPVRPVEHDGWDNTTFRLGDDMSVRLPSHAVYEPQVTKEHEWLPKLAPHLPLPIPVSLAMGEPSEDFPLHWSVRRWVEGDIALRAPISDLVTFASDVARFLTALYAIDASSGPAAGPHSFWRGGPLSIYELETRRAIETLGDRIDGAACTAILDAALATSWDHDPVWVHGDIAPDNLLVRDGRLSAVLDFGCSAVGDPACDLFMTWAFFSGPSRDAFRAGLDLDEGTWARGRGWVMWKSLIVLAREIGKGSSDEWLFRRLMDEVLAEGA